MDVAERIRLVLDEKGVTTEELAVRIGVDPSTTFRWSKGEAKPYKKHLQAIADAYGYSKDWLVAGRGERRGSVIGNDVFTNAAIIFRNAHTNKIWATAELLLRVRVHEPMEIIGGQGSKDIDVDAE